MSNKETIDTNNEFNETSKVGTIGIIGNIFLCILKSIAGISFQSQAMIADAMNSAGDIFSSVMTVIGGKISNRPRDDSHNYGHGKAEYLFSMFISISMILVAVKLIYNDIFNLITKQNNIIFSYYLIISALITILVKSILFIYTYLKSKKIESILLKANMKDHKNDCIVAIFTLVSILAARNGYGSVDYIVGIGISMWIAYTGIQIFTESFNVLMDCCVDEETKNKIMEIIQKYPDIKKIEHLNSSPLGAKYMISVSIFVDGNISTFKSHEIADKLEKEISCLNNIQLTVVHVNPI